MIAKTVNLKIMRGDSYTIGIQVKGLEATPSAVYFSCKKDYGAVDYIFQKSLDSGITAESIEDGIRYAVSVDPADTKDIDAPLKYRYDFEITVNGEIVTLLTGRLEVVPDVTRH